MKTVETRIGVQVIELVTLVDAYNGIDRRYTPIFMHSRSPQGASRRAEVIAAHTGLLVAS